MRIALAVLALAAGCHRVWGLSFDHPDAALDAREPDAPDAPRSLYAEAVLADNPLGYWRFTAGPPSAIDHAGQAPGVYTGNAAPGAPGALLGESDSAVMLDGAGDFVDMGSRFGFSGTAVFTIEAWVNPSVNGSYTAAFSKSDESSGGLVRVGYMMFNDSTAFGFERSNGAQVQDIRTAPLGTQRWTHVAIVYDGAALSLFTDGELRGVKSTPNPALPATTNPFVVGARNGGAYLWFTGGIDELAIYNHPVAKARLDAHRAIGLGQ